MTFLYDFGRGFCMMAFDENNEPVDRTKDQYPYNYSDFMQERVLPNEEATGTVYSDRLLDQDYVLTRKLMIKHFKDTGIDQGGDYWNNRSAASIQGFLRERLNRPNLLVVYVMECCNQSTGYPLWRIAYKG